MVYQDVCDRWHFIKLIGQNEFVLEFVYLYWLNTSYVCMYLCYFIERETINSISLSFVTFTISFSVYVAYCTYLCLLCCKSDNVL